MDLIPRRMSRRSGIAFVATLFLLASLLGGVADAASSTVRRFVPSISPTCVPTSTNVQFTATITNDSSSNKVLGSALFNSDASTFHNIFAGSFSTPTVSNPAKTWQAIPDLLDSDGIYLRAATSSSALAPGESVTVSFTALTPSSIGNRTWATYAWQSTLWIGSRFAFASGASNPLVQVAASCVAPAANIAFAAGPSSTAAGGTMSDVTVMVTDAGNNPVSGESVTLSSAGLATSPAGPQTTGPGGIATFSGLSVLTVAGSYTMTASDGALTTAPASFDITAGPPVIAFTQQPTDTLVDHAIAGGNVEVTMEDAYGNPVVDGTPITMSIGFDPTGSATLGGSTTQTTVSGVATFSDLTIDTTSSGYVLRATSGSYADSDPFAITNTDNSCDPCEAQFSDGHTVSAPAGTTLIIETNQLTCDSVGDFIAGTVTIIPGGSGVIPVMFTDTIDLPVGGPFPFCKTSGPPGDETVHDVPLCNTITDGFDQPDGTEPCVKESVEFTGPHDETAILNSILYIDSTDPHAKH